jgi:hypothetical protein
VRIEPSIERALLVLRLTLPCNGNNHNSRDADPRVRHRDGGLRRVIGTKNVD